VKAKIRKNKILFIYIPLLLIFCLISLYMQRSNFFNKGYNTAEAVIIGERSVNKENILGVIKSNNLFLVIYKNEIPKLDVVYENNGKYFLNRTSMPMVYSKFAGGRHIGIQKVLKKYMILVAENNSSSQISDNLSTSFSFAKIDYGVGSSNYWFKVLDQVPLDYQLYINGESLKIEVQN